MSEIILKSAVESFELMEFNQRNILDGNLVEYWNRSDLRTLFDECSKNIVFSIKNEVYSKVVDTELNRIKIDIPTISVPFHEPLNWFEMLKRDLLPNWVTKKFPIKTKTKYCHFKGMTVNGHARVNLISLFPEIPISGRVIKYAIADQSSIKLDIKRLSPEDILISEED